MHFKTKIQTNLLVGKCALMSCGKSDVFGNKEYFENKQEKINGLVNLEFKKVSVQINRSHFWFALRKLTNKIK